MNFAVYFGFNQRGFILIVDLKLPTLVGGMSQVDATGNSMQHKIMHVASPFNYFVSLVNSQP